MYMASQAHLLATMYFPWCCRKWGLVPSAQHNGTCWGSPSGFLLVARWCFVVIVRLICRAHGMVPAHGLGDPSGLAYTLLPGCPEGRGVWDQKMCVPNRLDFPDGSFRFSPRWSLWSGVKVWVWVGPLCRGPSRQSRQPLGHHVLGCLLGSARLDGWGSAFAKLPYEGNPPTAPPPIGLGGAPTVVSHSNTSLGRAG